MIFPVYLELCKILYDAYRGVAADQINQIWQQYLNEVGQNCSLHAGHPRWPQLTFRWPLSHPRWPLADFRWPLSHLSWPQLTSGNPHLTPVDPSWLQVTLITPQLTPADLRWPLLCRIMTCFLLTGWCSWCFDDPAGCRLFPLCLTATAVSRHRPLAKPGGGGEISRLIS